PVYSQSAPKHRRGATTQYRLTVESLPSDWFYRCSIDSGSILVAVNRDHPFFRSIYEPIMRGSSAQRAAFESLLYALARTELDAGAGKARYWFRRHKSTLGAVLGTFLGY